MSSGLADHALSKHAGDIFRQLADSFTHVGEDVFFDLITQRLSHLLNADYVLIARMHPHRHVATPVSFYTPQGHKKISEYPLHGTPCETVGALDTCYYADGVAELFPEDTMLADLGIQAYMGFPLLNRAGEKLGLIGVMHSQPLDFEDVSRQVLRISGAQIGVELERQATMARIRELAYTDTITGLPNRAAFTERLERELYEAMREQWPVSLVVLDIRRFKEINDTHGHDVGDILLSLVARRIQRYCEKHEFLARFGSDEFAIIMPRVSGADLALAIERIKSAFHDPVKIDSKLERFVEVNVGAAQYPMDTKASGSLFQHASIALEHAKRVETKSRIYDASMGEHLQQQQSKIERLAQAIRSDK